MIPRLCRIAFLAAAFAATPAAAQQAPTLFRGARVFDGERVLEAHDVLVRDGKIAGVGRGLSAPAGAVIVDATGKTLLPGFIDAHTHTFGEALQEAVVFGVTTHLDMFTDVGIARAMRAEQAAGRSTGRADLFSAGILATAPRGHGTQFGIPIPTITSPDSAQAWVDARIAEGSDWIKIVYDDGHTYGIEFATLDRPTLRALIEAAHRRGKLAVVHVGDADGARTAIEEGADGLVHLFADRKPDADFAALAAARGVFVIPTMTVLMSITGVGGGAALVGDARFADWLLPAHQSSLERGFPQRPGAPPTSYEAARSTVRQLTAAGVRVLAGTDAPNPGTAYGIAMHRELELLTQAGLTPVEALAAATSVPARSFRFADRGRIAPGLRADLLLVDGDPTTDITATRAIAGVWKDGIPIDRAPFARRVAAARAPQPTAAALANGMVSDFEGGTPAAALGSWMPSADNIAGGTSTGEMKVVEGGTNGSNHALSITGTIAGTVAYAWYGAMWTPGAQPMEPANLSARHGFAFWTQGDGQVYRVMVFARSKGMTPLTKTFAAGTEWSEISFSWEDFGIDGSDVMGIVLAGGPRPGTISLRIDDFRLR